MKILALSVILLMMMSPVLSVPVMAGTVNGKTSSVTTSGPSPIGFPMLPPNTYPNPDHTYNHWWDLDYWDTNSAGGSMPPYMNGEFIAQADTFGGLTEGSDFFNLIWYLPLNVAYGTNSTNCVWFQFAVRFVDPNPGSNGETVPSNMPAPVTWQIWDIKGPGGSDSDFHYTNIGLPYVVGHHYSWSLINSTGPTITFDIKDLTTSTEWSKSSWAWTIPSANMLPDESMFSPSSAIEGYTEPSTTSLSGTPFFQSRVGTSITKDRYYLSGGAMPSGIDTYRIEIADYEVWNWMMLGPGSLPAPAITSVSYPSIVHVGDTVTVEVNATNSGGNSQQQTIALSFPIGESVTSLAIVGSDLTGSAVYSPGYVAGAHYGLTTFVLSNYLLEGSETNWAPSANHYLKVSFKPNIGNGPFTFYVKSVASAKDWATDWTPTSGTKDQQGEYGTVYELTVDSIPPTTVLYVGPPAYSSSGHLYVTNASAFTLVAVDNVGGSGVASTAYRIYNGSYNTGWTPYFGLAFYLTGLTDGSYNIAFNSTDNAGNVEATHTVTVILDNTPPTTTLAIGNPSYTDGGGNLYVTSWTPFTLSATDAGSGVFQTGYRIRNATYSSGWLTYSSPFNLTGLGQSTYSIDYNSTDNLGNVETMHTKVVILNSKATMTGYSKTEIQSLKALVNGAAIPMMLKNFLLYNLLTFAISENDLALNYILMGNAAPANGALMVSRRTMQGFMSWVMNSRNFGMIPPATAAIWLAAAQTIVNDITTAIMTP